MYSTILEIHSIIRWAILVFAIAAVIDFWMGLFSKKKYGAFDNWISLLLTAFMDLQLLLGLALYFFLSPNVHLSGLDMSDAAARFYTVEHPVLMLLAIIFAHVGRAMAKKGATDAKKFQRGAIWFLVSLVCLLAGLPR